MKRKEYCGTAASRLLGSISFHCCQSWNGTPKRRSCRRSLHSLLLAHGNRSTPLDLRSARPSDPLQRCGVARAQTPAPCRTVFGRATSRRIGWCSPWCSRTGGYVARVRARHVWEARVAFGRLDRNGALRGPSPYCIRRHGFGLRGVRPPAAAACGSQDAPPRESDLALPVQKGVSDARRHVPSEPRSPPRARRDGGGANLLFDGARARHRLSGLRERAASFDLAGCPFRKHPSVTCRDRWAFDRAARAAGRD